MSFLNQKKLKNILIFRLPAYIYILLFISCYMPNQVTPWEVTGNIDYDKLIKEFGTQSLDNKIISRLKKPMPAVLRRELYFSHRDLDKWLDAYNNKERVTIVSGRGPSAKMHIAHLIPFITAKYFQDNYNCEVFIPLSDDEKYYVKPKLKYDEAEKFAEDNILDLIAVGFNPNKTKIHRDFQYTTIYKYAAKIAKHTTFSTAKAIFGLKNESNIGWVFYPAVQSAHIYLPQFLYGRHNTLVPIGIDQDPYMRILRDVAGHEELNFIKPGALHSKFIPGLSGNTKMSSSSENDVVLLTDNEKTVENKIKKYAFSGGRDTIKEHREKGGNPDVDVSFQWLKMMFEEDDKKLKTIYDDYKSGQLLTSELKQILIDKINKFLKKHQENREKAKKLVDKFILT